MLDCCSRIAQVEYQGQTRYTRILDRKSFICISSSIGHRLELKYFHFAQFLLNPHRAAHLPQKSENLELEILGRSSRSSYGWWVSNTVDDCLQRQIAKKIFKSKIEARPVKAGHFMAFKHRNSFATDAAATLVVIDSESCQTSFQSSLCCSILI